VSLSQTAATILNWNIVTVTVAQARGPDGAQQQPSVAILSLDGTLNCTEVLLGGGGSVGVCQYFGCRRGRAAGIK